MPRFRAIFSTQVCRGSLVRHQRRLQVIPCHLIKREFGWFERQSSVWHLFSQFYRLRPANDCVLRFLPSGWSGTPDTHRPPFGTLPSRRHLCHQLSLDYVPRSHPPREYHTSSVLSLGPSACPSGCRSDCLFVLSLCQSVCPSVCLSTFGCAIRIFYLLLFAHYCVYGHLPFRRATHGPCAVTNEDIGEINGPPWQRLIPWYGHRYNLRWPDITRPPV